MVGHSLPGVGLESGWGEGLTGHEGGVAPARAHATYVDARPQRLRTAHLAPSPRAQRLSEATETEAEPGPGPLSGHAPQRPLPAATWLGSQDPGIGLEPEELFAD